MRLAGLALLACLLEAQPASAMVALRRPHGHRETYIGVFGSGLGSYAFDREDGSGVLGGGLFVTWEMSGGWPLPWSTGAQDLNWAFDPRARHLTSFDDDRQRTSLPLDAVVRLSRVRYPREPNYIDHSGWPTAVYEAPPFVPYVGAGVTVDIPLTGDGGTHAGVVVVGGAERWLTRNIGVHAELELRGMLLDGGVVQAGVNAGVLVAF